MKHVPGPWKARKVPAGNWFIEAELKHPKGKAISHIFEVPVLPHLYSATLKDGVVTVEMAYSAWYQFGGGDWNEGTGEANAKLMAAAPELLEACKAMAEYLSGQWDDWDSRPNCLCLAEQAIKKAEDGE